MARRDLEAEMQLDGGPGEGDPSGTESTQEESLEKTEPVKDINQMILEELREIRRERADLGRQVRETKAPKKERDEVEKDPFGDDFDKLVFDDPRKAFQRFGDNLVKRITKELGGKYETDQNQKVFWDDFYQKNDDLKEDRDLVQTVLQSNMQELADMPVEKASKRLAELTRERIARYSQVPSVKKRPVTEGVNTGGGRRAPAKRETEDQPKVTTLSELLRSRRAVHRKGAAA